MNYAFNEALRAKYGAADPNVQMAWFPVELPPDDGDEIVFPPNTAYAAVAEIHPGYKAADIMPKLGPNAKYFANWTIQELGTSEDGPWNPQAQPGMPWNALLTQPPPNGHAWAFVKATSPAAGDTELVARTPFSVFVYRIKGLWQLAPQNKPPSPLVKPPAGGGFPWVPVGIGVGALGLAGLGLLAWKKRWFR